MPRNAAGGWAHWSHFQDWHCPPSALEPDFLFPASAQGPAQRERWWRWWGWSLRWGIPGLGSGRRRARAGVSRAALRCFHPSRCCSSPAHSSLRDPDVQRPLQSALQPSCCRARVLADISSESPSASGVCTWGKPA